MTSLYLYALLGVVPPRGRWRGLDGEPLRFVRVAGLVLAAGPMSRAPAPKLSTLRRHDAVVRRLAGAVPAVLPARFGTLVTDGAALRELIAPRAAALRRALAQVAGREQMTLRLYGSAPRGGGVEAAAPLPSGPGTRYLTARSAATLRALPDLARLRGTLAGLVRAERIEPSQTPPLLGSVYHLVDRDQRRAYQRALRSVTCQLADLRVVPSGPWTPYAFAPEPGG
ncbi:MAG TPA: GvpL/GvpF family gas vesicle protein [Pseudomonadales bacterium]|nr:GvpL/GvpF family gas vesicle protein [Pseudomonadales bacterium]